MCEKNLQYFERVKTAARLQKASDVLEEGSGELSSSSTSSMGHSGEEGDAEGEEESEGTSSSSEKKEKKGFFGKFKKGKRKDKKGKKGGKEEDEDKADVPMLPEEDIRVAYVGHADNDDEDVYEYFLDVCSEIGMSHCRMIPTECTEEDTEFVKTAHIIVLSHGLPELGLRSWKSNGLHTIFRERYRDGCVFVGVSAGAVSMGIKCWGAAEESTIFECLGLFPYYIDADQESDQYAYLQRLLQHQKAGEKVCPGYGIPRGIGMISFPKGKIMAVRGKVLRFDLNTTNGRVDKSEVEASITKFQPNIGLMRMDSRARLDLPKTDEAITGFVSWFEQEGLEGNQGGLHRILEEGLDDGFGDDDEGTVRMDE
eukprot:TRINITY_DN3704_c0_g1_i9.p1 TRINITY_DN3704_c0_g1~~TRINITY_DN3704_c0_g1_i9.p1  ORF type:complete len:369 (+),score=110.29 TRINITY_DN3704_c0_g1_i9:1993-3099(+)